MHSSKKEESTTATSTPKGQAGIQSTNCHKHPPTGAFFFYNRIMSNLNNEAILESIYEDLVVEFRTELLSMTQTQIDAMVMERFEAMSW